MEWINKGLYYSEYPTEFESVIRPKKYFPYRPPLIMYSYHPYIKKSNFESKLYEDTIAEIERLENELNETRQFLALLGDHNPSQAKPSIPERSQKATGAKTARKAAKPKQAESKGSTAKSARKKAKPKLTKSGKKIGRPTNAEKWVKENAEVIEKGLEQGIKHLKSEGQI